MMDLSREELAFLFEEYNLKIRLERRLIIEVNEAWGEMATNFKRVYDRESRVSDFEEFKPLIKSILSKHYQSVNGVFAGRVAQVNSIQMTDNDIANEAFNAWANITATEATESIAGTTADNARLSVEQAQQRLTDNDESLSAGAVASLGAVLLRAKLRGRTNGIATTETNSASETRKTIDAMVIARKEPPYLGYNPFAFTDLRDPDVKEGRKQWITANDDRVRPAHRNADGQEVDIDKPFIVGGFEMSQPGDRTSGAPASLWHRCRCASFVKI